MHSDAYGLVFGINNFVTILSITLFTFFFVDKNGPLNLGIEQMVGYFFGFHKIPISSSSPSAFSSFLYLLFLP